MTLTSRKRMTERQGGQEKRARVSVKDISISDGPENISEPQEDSVGLLHRIYSPFKYMAESFISFFANRTTRAILPNHSERLKLKERVRFLKSLFHGDPVKDSFLELMKHLKSFFRTNDGRYPSCFLCSPSGSGKTTFVQNICCGSSPAAFVLFSMPEYSLVRSQEVYMPFFKISRLLIDMEMQDLEMLGRRVDLLVHSALNKKKIISEEERGKTETLLEEKSWTSFLQCDCMYNNALSEAPFRFNTVGLIVSLFKRLINEKARNPEKSWLELECNLESLTFGPMSIQEGIDNLLSIYPPSNILPLMLFVDECSLNASAESFVGDNLVRRFQLVRNICRCMNIVVVFSGTDARASNLVLQFGSGSGGQLKKAFWKFIFNVMPSFDKSLLDRRCSALLTKFEGFPRLKKLVIFVQNVSERELPWFVDLFLRNLENIPLEQISTVDPLSVFSAGAANCLDAFVIRKKMSASGSDKVTRDDVLFLRGQKAYTCNFSWEDVALQGGKVRTTDHADELNINRHLGYLFGYPDYQDGPYFSLALGTDERVYHRTISEEGTSAVCKYSPKSVFTSFFDAPLTGLALFGLSTGHRCFGTDERISVLDSFLMESRDSSTGQQNSGINLELLFHTSAIVASRAGGLSGCRIIPFTEALIQEMSTSPTDTIISLSCHEERSLPQNTIPLLSPMSMSGWNPHLVELLKSFEPDCRLGVYRSTKANDRCDGIGYYYDPDETFLEDMNVEEMGKALDKLRKRNRPDYPMPLYPPTQRGRIMKIASYPSQVAFVGECKQHSDSISIKQICMFVEGKFLRQKEFDNCPFFFLVAYKFAADLNSIDEATGEPKLVIRDEKGRVKPVAFWYLERLPDIVNNKKNVGFSLNKVATVGKGRIKRHAILLSLETIWGKDFKTNMRLFNKIPER